MPPGAHAFNKIAVVNVSTIFQKLPQRVEIAKKLEKEFEGRATELQSMERDLQINMQRLQNGSATMQSSERLSLENALIAQRENFSTKAQAFEQENRYRQTEERNKILKQIEEVVKNIAIKEGYNIVIDANAVAYAVKSNDITDDVLKQVK
nr:OmpH family outer membrane protein [secondary endosymbiont of Heteropsylla cubana]